MPRPKVFVCRRLPDKVLAQLSESCDVDIWDHESEVVPRDVLMASIPKIDGILTMLTDMMDSELLNQAERLQVISNMAVGYDNVDLQAAKANKIVVTNTPDVLTEATADLTFALLLATARRVTEAAEYLKADRWKSWSPMLLAGQDVYGKTLGIVGMGKIGASVARRARGFSMKIVYHNRSRRPDVEDNLDVTYVPLEELLSTSDFVVIMTPLTKETQHLIGAPELGLMKRSGILINTARGPVVDETALCKALSEGTIWGAGVDVFEQEPASSNHPLVQFPNVVALPHIGSSTIATRTKMAAVAVENLLAVLAGHEPPHRVV